MISVENAMQLIHKNVNRNPVVRKEISGCLGLVLAEDIHSSIDMPPFPQSAMDGYAVSFESQTYKVIGEIRAGDDASSFRIGKEEAYRIFTGAMIPKNTKFVVVQEAVERDGNHIKLKENYKFQSNIRLQGEQLFKNEIAAKKGSLLNAGLIGFLAMIGIREVLVYDKPKICVVATGSELSKPGEYLKPGKIYESNGIMLQMALVEYGFDAETMVVTDNLEQTKNELQKALKRYDLVFITGGISVGDYDFVYESLQHLGVEEVFYKVKQKPGKPLFFGKKGNTIVFGLPGNPAAALTSFYVYGLSAISGKIGRNENFVREAYKKLAEDIQTTEDKTFFLKGIQDDTEVKVSKGQSSAMLNGFTEANCFIILSQGKSEWKKGDEVKTLELKF